MKKTILKFVLVGIILVAICTGAYFLLRAFGLNDIETLREIVNRGVWGIIIYIISILVFKVFKIDEIKNRLVRR